MTGPQFTSRSEVGRVGAVASGVMKTARLIVDGGSQAIGMNETVTIKWDIPLDDTDSWDDIGLGGTGAEYNTTGTIVFPDGFEYKYDLFAQVDPDTAYTTGGILLESVYSGVVNEKHKHAVTQDAVPGLTVFGAYRVLIGNQTMTCVLLSDDLDDTGTITEASLYIKQIKAF